MTQHGDAERVRRLCNDWPPVQATYGAADSGEKAQ